MSIISFQRSRFMRATAGLTLTFFLAGCLPGTVKPGGAANDTASSMSDHAGALLAQVGSITNVMSSASDALGVQLPGAKKGYDHRSWTAADQAAAERAMAAFNGKPIDNLPVYDPTKAGEAVRYAAKVKALVAKYKDREQLTAAEGMEFAEVVIPMMRFLMQSEAYRSNKSNKKVVRNAKGNDTVVIPAFSTVEMAALTYCNDHGLPAPWRGEKLTMRPLVNYIPSQLESLYTDLHKYAATNPSAHYKMQSLVWTLRDNPCSSSGLSASNQQLIEAAHKGGMAELQKYCMTKRLKDAVAERAQSMIPGSSQLASMQQYINQAQDYQAKAQMFLAADLSNPAEMLKLAQTAGLQSNFSRSPLLDNPYLKTAMPLLKQSGLANALTPKGTEDTATATALGVMEQLGRTLGESVGEDKGSIADYSDLGNGLYAKVYTPGGASNAKIDVINTSGQDQVLSNSDFVLSSVNDPATGRSNYQPTQRLSIGPLQPISVHPNDQDGGKKYTPKNEKDVKQALDPLKGMKAGIGEKPTEEAKKDIPCPTGTVRWADVGKNVASEVVKSIPFIGNIFNGYMVATGTNPITGEKVEGADLYMAALSAAIPGGAWAGAAYRGLRAGFGIRRTMNSANTAFDIGNTIAGNVDILKNVDGAYYEFTKGDNCEGWKNLAGAASGAFCAGSKSKAACSGFTGMTAALGAAQTERNPSQADELFIDIENVSTSSGVAGLSKSLSTGVDTVKGWFK